MNTIWFPDLTTPAAAADTRPKYKVIMDAIVAAIADDNLIVDEQLPPVREVAWRVGITPGTVARAYKELVSEGVLRAAVGRGTFVAPQNTAYVTPLPTKMIKTEVSEIDDWPEIADLRSPIMPDVGQGRLVQAVLREVAEAATTDVSSYPNSVTDAPARAAVLKWLNHQYVGNFDVNDIVLAHGGQNAMTLILQTVLRGDKPVIFADELSYSGFRHAARQLRAEIVGIESDDEGMRPDRLHEAIHTYGGQVLCISPSVNNPTVQQMGLIRRREIAQVVSRHQLQLIEDDCYYAGPTDVPSFRALIPEHAWYVSSLSKSFSPALRVGYAVAPRGMGTRLRRSGQYNFFGVAQYQTDMITRLLSRPETQEQADAVRTRINQYVRVAVNVLGAFDIRWRDNVPLIWMTLPRGWRGSTFRAMAEREGVVVRTADDFAMLDGRAPHAIRIAINGNLSLERFEEALSRLSVLLSTPQDLIEV